MFFDDAKKEAKVSKIPNNVNIKNVSEPNIDTLTYSKAVKTNNKLSTVLKAKQALEFGKYFTFVNAALKPSDVKRNRNFDRLLFTNKKILLVLKKIEANLIDEQDTSIKHKPKDSKNQTVNKNVIAPNAHDENGLGLGLDLPNFKPPKPKVEDKEKLKEKEKEKEQKAKEKEKEQKAKEKLKPKVDNKSKTQKVDNKSKVKPTKTPKKTPKNIPIKKVKVHKKPGNDTKVNDTKVEGQNGKELKTEKPNGKPQSKRVPAYKRGPYKKHQKVEPTKEPVNEPGKGTNVNETKVNKTEANSQPNNTPKAEQGGKLKIARSAFIKTGRVLARGASLVGTGIVIGEGVYLYINAECEADRMDAIASTTGALAGMAAGAKIGALAGVWAGPLGVAAGALIGAGIGALAGSALGEWISGKLKTPLDLIPDKFKNRGPKIEYAYIETKLLPLVDNMPYESDEDYNEAFDTVEDRMIELVEEMKKGPTEEQQREWDKNKLINEDVITDNWSLSFNGIKDWKKVENLSDSDLDILLNDAKLTSLDKDRVREIKFMRNAKNNTEAQTTVSAIDRVNQAIEAEKKRLEEYRKENTFDSFSGFEFESDNYRRSLKTIQQLQQVKKTMLSQAEKGDYKSIELDEKYRDINNNSAKQFNSLTLQNTSLAERLANVNIDADSYATQWATSYSAHKDISKSAIADFSSIKAADIQFNKNDHLGFVSGEFESGGNPGVIAKDNIGYAYGAWQMNSQVGALRDFIKSIKNDERFARLAELKIDSPEFQNEWARVAKEYPNAFLEKQHEFIEKTKFKPVLDYARSAGLNTTNRAVQEALWSQAVQHGFEGNKKIIDAAVKKVGKSSSADEIVRALYESRADYINGLSTLSDSLKVQINDRYRRESSKALAIVSNEDFQKSDITKSVNSDSDVPLTNEESNSENSKNGTETQKSNEDEKSVTDISTTEKVLVNETPVDNLDKNMTTTAAVTQVVQNVEPPTNQKSSTEDADLTEWTVQVPS